MCAPGDHTDAGAAWREQLQESEMKEKQKSSPGTTSEAS